MQREDLRTPFQRLLEILNVNGPRPAAFLAALGPLDQGMLFLSASIWHFLTKSASFSADPFTLTIPM